MPTSDSTSACTACRSARSEGSPAASSPRSAAPSTSGAHSSRDSGVRPLRCEMARCTISRARCALRWRTMARRALRICAKRGRATKATAWAEGRVDFAVTPRVPTLRLVPPPQRARSAPMPPPRTNRLQPGSGESGLLVDHCKLKTREAQLGFVSCRRVRSCEAEHCCAGRVLSTTDKDMWDRADDVSNT